MSRFKSSTQRQLLVLALFLASSLLIPTLGDEGEHVVNLKKQRPNAVESAIGIEEHLSPWDKIKSWIKIAWLNFWPPLQQTEKEHRDAGEVVKEAVTKSFETSKETAEKAAKVAGHAVHETAQKVKKSVSSGREEM